VSHKHVAQEEGGSRGTARTAELKSYITTIVLSLQPHEPVVTLNFCNWFFYYFTVADFVPNWHLLYEAWFYVNGYVNTQNDVH
jgi:hypothetical protein